MDLAERTQYVNDRFDDTFRVRAQMAVAMPPREDWEEMPLGPEHQYGWIPPIHLTEDEPRLMISVCPEIIAEQTMFLEDAEFEQYVRFIIFLIGRHIQWFDQGLSYRDLQNKFEEELLEKAERPFRFWSEVQLEILDRKLATS